MVFFTTLGDVREWCWLSVIGEVLLLFPGTLKHIHASLSLGIHASKGPRNSNNTSPITTCIICLSWVRRVRVKEKRQKNIYSPIMILESTEFTNSFPFISYLNCKIRNFPYQPFEHLEINRFISTFYS